MAYADKGDRLLGTGGGVRLAVDEGILDGGFLVLYGGSYLSLDIGALAEADQLSGEEATERFYEIGSPQGLADLEAHLASTT